VRLRITRRSNLGHSIALVITIVAGQVEGWFVGPCLACCCWPLELQPPPLRDTRRQLKLGLDNPVAPFFVRCGQGLLSTRLSPPRCLVAVQKTHAAERAEKPSVDVGHDD